MLVLLGIAFLAGVITAVSPCVLPVLPIILAGSVSTGNRWRPYAIMAGLVVSFTTFTLAGAALLSALGLPEDLLRDIAIAALLLLAVTLVSRRASWLAQRPLLLLLTRRQPSPDSSGLVLGLSLGLVFVPCAGPVLAAVTALAALGDVGIWTVLVMSAYAIGAALPMLAIAVGSQQLAAGARLVRTHAQTTRRVAGVVVGASAVAIALGADQRFATAVPGYTEALQERIERNARARAELGSLTGSGGGIAVTDSLHPRAPELRGIETWLNTSGEEPPSLARLRGRVVLIDFWTYSCINCLRTLPHLKAWDRAYRKAGLTIVGVHSPEFAFERVPDNVRSAVRRLGLRYPIALDNDFATWRAYDNQYWPAKYLIDRSGRIRYQHFGEGAYGETEGRIRNLLSENLPASRTSVADRTPGDITTPESYLGYLRLERFLNLRLVADVESEYRFPGHTLPRDHVAYAGRWTVEPERIVAGTGARLRLGFQANDVFLVLAGSGRVAVLVDGRPLRTIPVFGTPRLYTIARFPRLQRGALELRFTPGVAAYAFTFG